MKRSKNFLIQPYVYSFKDTDMTISPVKIIEIEIYILLA